MKRRAVSPILVVGCALLGMLSTTAQAAQQAGAVPQPPPTGEATTAAPAAAGGSDAELAALVNSPEARSVAVFRCSSAQAECPLNKSNSGTLSGQFDDALLTGESTPTALITALRALLGEHYNTDAIWPVGVDVAIVHLVKFSEDGASHRGRWLLFERRRGRTTASAGTRIMGAKRIAVVFVHLGVEIPKGRQAAGVYANVEYRAIAKPKLPINVQRLLGLLRIAAARAQDAMKPEKEAVLGFGLYTDVPVPSDLTVFGTRLGAVPAGFGGPITYDNEGKYFWDASVAVPINKMTLLDYDDVDGTFAPKAINKQSIYGTINLYPFPVDIKDGTLRWIVPRAMVGIGMTGRPGETFLLAGAFGIKEFQVFVGSAFANQRVLKPGTDPANGANYTQRYASRLTYGINVPVVSALKKLTGSK